MKQLGIVLRKWRTMEERQMRDVAKEIGVSASTLCRLEAGKDTDAQTLMRILNWLLVPKKPHVVKVKWPTVKRRKPEEGSR